MSGTDIGQYAGRGLNYRALDDLFDLNRARDAEVSYAISVQLLEIYNEVCWGIGGQIWLVPTELDLAWLEGFLRHGPLSCWPGGRWPQAGAPVGTPAAAGR